MPPFLFFGSIISWGVLFVLGGLLFCGAWTLVIIVLAGNDPSADFGDYAPGCLVAMPFLFVIGGAAVGLR